MSPVVRRHRPGGDSALPASTAERRIPSRRPAILLVALVVVGLVGAPVRPVAAQDADDLARARDQIAEIEAELTQANDAAEDAEAGLDNARQALERIEAVVNAVAQRVEEQGDIVRVARAELTRLQEQEAQARSAIQRKAIELYKRAGAGELSTLVEARDIQSAIERSSFLRIVGRLDTARIEDLDVAVRQRGAAAEVLAREQEALDGLLADREAVMAEAERVRESRALAAAAAEDDVHELEAEHAHLSDLEAEIEQAIAARKAAEEAARRAAEEAAAAAAASAAAGDGGGDSDGGDSDGGDSDAGDEGGAAPPPVSGGGYAWPLCGIVTSEYGWRWGRQHEGIDIDDTYTDRIVAAQSGTVIYAGYNSGGYGNLVLIQHGDGVVTAYAHQRAIAVSNGQSVGRGELVGYVGSTGNSTGPHLHFETRVGGGSAVNPRQFLPGGC